MDQPDFARLKIDCRIICVITKIVCAKIDSTDVQVKIGSTSMRSPNVPTNATIRHVFSCTAPFYLLYQTPVTISLEAINRKASHYVWIFPEVQHHRVIDSSFEIHFDVQFNLPLPELVDFGPNAIINLRIIEHQGHNDVYKCTVTSDSGTSQSSEKYYVYKTLQSTPSGLRRNELAGYVRRNVQFSIGSALQLLGVGLWTVGYSHFAGKNCAVFPFLELSPTPKFTAKNIPSIISSIRTLHSFGYIHNDIKPSNIAFISEGKAAYAIDYDVSTSIPNASNGGGYTFRYASERHTNHIYAPSNDFYSLSQSVFLDCRTEDILRLEMSGISYIDFYSHTECDVIQTGFNTTQSLSLATFLFAGYPICDLSRIAWIRAHIPQTSFKIFDIDKYQHPQFHSSFCLFSQQPTPMILFRNAMFGAHTRMEELIRISSYLATNYSSSQDYLDIIHLHTTAILEFLPRPVLPRLIHLALERNQPYYYIFKYSYQVDRQGVRKYGTQQYPDSEFKDLLN